MKPFVFAKLYTAKILNDPIKVMSSYIKNSLIPIMLLNKDIFPYQKRPEHTMSTVVLHNNQHSD